MSWYIVKKKTATRWTAYELDKTPEVKRGYEIKGPYKSLAACLIAANLDKTS